MIGLTLLAALAACSGGASTEKNADTSIAAAQSVNYTGPAPNSGDVQAFKNELWVNIVSSSRCGGCHNANGQAPTFARRRHESGLSAALQMVINDQINPSYQGGSGHNC
jgi:hypothetical protein